MIPGSGRSVYSGAASTIDPLQRRVPRNPKYEHVQGVVDTGMNVRKVQNITTREYLKRKNELFKRVRPSSVYRLLCDHEERHESIYEIGEEGSGEGGFEALHAGSRGGDERKVDYGGGAKASARSGAVQIVTHAADDAVPEVERKPYLILDVRDPDDFAACHVLEAVSYPGPRISQDRITPQLFSYKNKADTMIIVYDDDEKVAAGVATTFVQKGWENVYLMSGGLKIAGTKFPLMVEGDLPERLLTSASPGKGTSRGGRGSSSSRMSTASGYGGASVAGSRRGGSRASTRGARSVRSSAADASSPKTCATSRSFASSKATSGAWH